MVTGTYNDLAIADLRVYSDNPNDPDVPAMGVQWTKIPVTSDNYAYYKGEAWVNKSTGEIIISNRGTALSSIRNWGSDGLILIAGVNPAKSAAEQFAKDAIDYIKYNPGMLNSGVSISTVYTTGHSYGFSCSSLQAAYLSTNSDYFGYTYYNIGFDGYGVGYKVSAGANVHSYNFFADGDKVYGATTMLENTILVNLPGPTVSAWVPQFLASHDMGYMQELQSNTAMGLQLVADSYNTPLGLQAMASISTDTWLSMSLYQKLVLCAGINTIPTGPTTNLFNLTNTTSFDSATQSATGDGSLVINNNTLSYNDLSMIQSLLGTDVNTDRGNTAWANYSLTDFLRPGNNNTYNVSLMSMLNLDLLQIDPKLTAAGANTATNWQSLYLAPTDPLVLDLNGDGVKLTDYGNDPVLFDADHDGGYREQTGWVSPQDGILVYDGYNTTPNGTIDDISETLSEYFGGTAGTGGAAGTKPFTSGFTALKSLDTGNGTPGSVGYNDNQFTNADADWSNVKVWVDANHDGKSWVDTDNDGIKDTGEATELKTLNELGITQINLTTTSQSGLMNNGNEVLASGTFSQYVDASGNPAPTGTLVTRAAVAANLLNNPDGHDFTTSGTGMIVTTQASGGASGVTAYEVLSSTGETVDDDDKIYAGNLIRFRKRLLDQKTWRRISEQEKLRRTA